MRAIPLPLLRLRPLLSVCLLAAGMGLAGAAAGQEGPAVLLVRTVHGESALPLQGAQVVVQGIGIGGLSDAQGSLRLEMLSAGTRAVEARFLGYAPARAWVLLEAGRTATVTFLLEPQPVRLAEVQVRAPRHTLLRVNGFYERQQDGFGIFVTRDQIERVQARHLSDVLRRYPGINLAANARGGGARASMRGSESSGPCPIQYYVDGIPAAQFNIDELPADVVEGMEIYRGAATVPPLFRRGNVRCGVVVIWTRIE